MSLSQALLQLYVSGDGLGEIGGVHVNNGG